MQHEVHTWADGFGRWYASAPAGLPPEQARAAARRAIRRELAQRGQIGPGYRLKLEPAPGFGPGTFRELW